MNANMQDIIAEAIKLASYEIDKFGFPSVEHFNLANEVGQRLAKHFGANADIVMLGTILMDYKLGECIVNGNASSHIKESRDGVKLFLDNFEIDEDLKNKILNCVESHHDTKLAKSIEAEIVANADCYRFLSPKGFFSAMNLFGKKSNNISEVLQAVNGKIDEKWQILSLDFCKDELRDSHNSIKYLINNSK